MFWILLRFLLVCDVVRVAGSKVGSVLLCVRREKVITRWDGWVSAAHGATAAAAAAHSAGGARSSWRSVGPQRPLGKVGTAWRRQSSPGVKAAGLSPRPGTGGGGAEAGSEGFCPAQLHLITAIALERRSGTYLILLTPLGEALLDGVRICDWLQLLRCSD